MQLERADAGDPLVSTHTFFWRLVPAGWDDINREIPYPAVAAWNPKENQGVEREGGRPKSPPGIGR